jgi:hypothetical protein
VRALHGVAAHIYLPLPACTRSRSATRISMGFCLSAVRRLFRGCPALGVEAPVLMVIQVEVRSLAHDEDQRMKTQSLFGRTELRY